jgi:hypothetical protein
MASVTRRAQFWQVMPLTSNIVVAEFCRASDSTLCGVCMYSLEHFIADKGLRRILFGLPSAARPSVHPHHSKGITRPDGKTAP